MAQPVRPGGLRAIEHVIVLMQENRSFDHYYGALRGVRGYGDRQPLRLRLRNGKSIFHQPKTGGGEVLPFSLRKAAADAGRNPDDIQYLGALAHGFGDATQAWAGGWNDDWVQAKTAATIPTTTAATSRCSTSSPRPSRSATRTTARSTVRPTRTATTCGPAPSATSPVRRSAR
jgi:hypothetical protein